MTQLAGLLILTWIVATPGQVAFAPEGGKLLATTKGNTGAVEVFDVYALDGVSLHPVVTSLPAAIGGEGIVAG